MKKWISTIAIVCMILLGSQFATAQTNNTLHTTHDPLKSWTITFSAPVNVASVHAQSIYMTNNAGQKIEATVTVDNKKVKVTPKQSYQANETYQVHVTSSVTSTNGKASKSMNIPFMYKASTSAITSVQTNYSSVVTNVVVKGSPDVFAVVVTANGKNHELKYSQGNTYSLGILGLSKGTPITVKAFDADNNVIETKQVNVQ